MNEEIDIYFDKDNGACYLESLIRSRLPLIKSGCDVKLVNKLDAVLDLELDLAILGAEKAKAEILKDGAKENIRKIK